MDSDKLLQLTGIFLKEAKKKGRSDKSMKKQYKTMTKGKKHPFKSMVEKFKKHPEITDPEGLAAKLKDLGEGTTKWRKGRSKNKD